MKVRGRTVLLCVIALQMTLLYSTSYEIVKYLSRNDHSDINSSSDLTLYIWIFSCTSILALCCQAILFGFGMAPHFAMKKFLVLVICAVQVIAILPFNLSGFYLYYQTIGKDSVQINKETATIYKEFTYYVNESSYIKNETANATFSSNMAIFNKVTSLNSFYCCCGLQESSEFGPQFAGKLSTSKDSNLTLYTLNEFNFSCPSHNVNANYRCNVKEFEGCAIKLPRLHRLLIIVPNSIFTVCTLISIGLTIPIYASFEFDRRKARTVYIRNWIGQTKREIEVETGKSRRMKMSETKIEQKKANTNIMKSERTQNESIKLERPSGKTEESSKTTEKSQKSQKREK